MLSVHINDNGELVFTLNDRQAFWDALEANERRGCTMVSDSAMCEVFETVFANSEYDWVLPEDIGALTECPIIANYPKGDADTYPPETKVWWYPQGYLKSPLEDLFVNDSVIFQKGYRCVTKS